MDDARSINAAEVVSGQLYRITVVNQREPRTLADFAGSDQLTLEAVSPTGARLSIVGSGHATEQTVRLHEKDGPGGKDVRTWHVTQDGTGFYLSVHAAF